MHKRNQQLLKINILSFLVSVLILILLRCFDRALEEGDTFSTYLEGYKKEALIKLSNDSSNVFGYNISKRTTVKYCFLIVIGYALYFYTGVKIEYIESILSSMFLSLTHSILILWFYDEVIPGFLLHLINIAIKWRAKIIRLL